MNSPEINSPGINSPGIDSPGINSPNNTANTALALTPPPASRLTSQSVGQAHLRFQLTETLTCAFSMDEIHEVVVISPAQLTPVFNMPACVLGLLTHRSRILWTVDLAALLFDDEAMPGADAANVGQSKTDQSRTSQSKAGQSKTGQYSIVIVRVNATERVSASDFVRSPTENQPLLGLLVQNIRGYIQLDPASIQRPEAHSAKEEGLENRTAEKSIISGLLPYLRGSVFDGDKALQVLDVGAIAARLKQKTVEGLPPKIPPLKPK